MEPLDSAETNSFPLQNPCGEFDSNAQAGSCPNKTDVASPSHEVRMLQPINHYGTVQRDRRRQRSLISTWHVCVFLLLRKDFSDYASAFTARVKSSWVSPGHLSSRPRNSFGHECEECKFVSLSWGTRTRRNVLYSSNSSPWGDSGVMTNCSDFTDDENVNGDQQSSSQKQKKKKKKVSTSATTAPEVNIWTSLMADVRRATSIYRNGKTGPSPKEQVQAIQLGLANLSEQDYKNIETYWESLHPSIDYLDEEGIANVKEALRVAYYAHRHQKRKSGEPFVIHPIAVAELLAGLRMDADTVMAGLLHDTVEDTELTFTQVEEMFGHVVRSIVEGETKVSKLPKLGYTDFADEQAENLRQMFVAMTDDYRIIIVKLADRLHNMRTLQFMKPEKQKKISRETLDIFAPLAHRMGIWQFKSELEDTSFMYLYPSEYKRLNRRLKQHQTHFRETLDNAKEILKKTLDSDATLKEQAGKVEVFGRMKEMYSLWYKMEMKAETELDHITDVVALRIVLYPKENGESEEGQVAGADRGVWLCYHVLGLVQHLPGFQAVPTRVKDYISFPKPNGYQSLHTAVMLNGQTIEVQIRTAAMHHVAEYGMASHWAYSDEKHGMDELYNTPWLSTIKEWQDDMVCSRDFVECVQRELLGKRVFVFLRNGKILNMARGATVIDVAFQIHTEVGLNMHGAHINGKPAPLSYELRNGDVVSILTGEGKPSTEWMRFAKSRSTRAKLRSYFRSKQRDSFKEAGAILLADFLDTHKNLLSEVSFLDHMIPTSVEEFGTLLPGKTQYDDLDELLVAIGKRHDRAFLRSTVSKVLKVPLWAINQAEKFGKFGRQTREPAIRSRPSTESKDSGSDDERENDHEGEDVSLVVDDESPSSLNLERERNGFHVASSSEVSVLTADFDHLCETCLPVKGDEIVGTKPVNPTSPRDDVVHVHRRGCFHAERALNRSVPSPKVAPEKSKNRETAYEVILDSANGVVPSEEVGNNNGKNVSQNNIYFGSANGASNPDVAELKNGKTRPGGSGLSGGSRFSKRKSVFSMFREEVPVKLKWPDLTDDVNVSYLAEVLIIANDRKLLLADCSEVVSQLAFIVKTGSSTTHEHASLQFLVKVKDLDHLQHLMNNLRMIPSVMSVERKFGSELL